MQTLTLTKAISGACLALAMIVASAAIDAASPAERIAEGKEIAFDRKKGNCLACHAIEDGELPGNLGPALVVMKARFPDRSALKSRISDPSLNNPTSAMPPFGKNQILTDKEIELVIDYLYTL